ncbi:MAG: hypothetical protein CMF60_04270 [Magnetococcales bacterium]|nr:hypothetical protein [Magnetococcales bacterium]
MKRTRKIFIHMPYKLNLPEASARSRVLLSMFHVCLLFNWLFVTVGLLPLAGLLPVLIILLYEHQKKTAFTQTAVHFAWKRFIFHVIIILLTALYALISSFSEPQLIQAYILQAYVLIPLAGYDAYQTFKGGLGLELLKPLREKIRKIRG